MRAFQTVFATIAAVATVTSGQTYRAYGSYGLGGGLSYGSGLYGSRISTISAAPVSYGFGGYSGYSAAPVSYSGSYVASAPALTTVAAAPAVSYAVAAPVATRVATVAAAPAVTYAAAPAVSYAAPAVSVAAAPVNIGVVATAGAPSVRSHEIHTGSGNTAIRIEDFQAGDQVIRVHEGPQAGPQIAQIQVPGEQHHVRIINHQSGPAQVQRVVSRQATQVVDVQKPGRPGARIVQVVKGQSPAPSIEFVQAGGSSHHVYYADDVNGGAAGGAVIGGGSIIGAAGLSTAYAAPSVALSAAPVATRTIAVAAAPVATGTVAVSAAPVGSYATRVVSAAPSISYGYGSPISYGLGGFQYGGLGYSTGYNSYGNLGNNVFLDAKKKSASKKSA